MRPGQQNKRGRGRGSNNNGGSGGGGGGNNNFQRKGGNPLSRTYDSSGPDVKIRGTAQHIAEKYTTLGRDAQSSGDRVMAENYLQHAEHYNRIIAAAQAQMQDRFQQQERDGNSIDQDDMDGDEGDDLGYAPQPVIEDQQRRDDQQRREQAPREQAPREQTSRGEQAPRGEQAGQAQDQQPRENRRDRNEPRRERRPDRQERSERPAEQKAPAEQPVTAAVAEISAPVVDGSGPQPVIEGTPAEVAVEEEAQTEAAPRRRRAAASRPRRQPRKSADAEGAEGDDAPSEMADVAGE
jgi:hypothetical protein